jgi:hypothetical protein
MDYRRERLLEMSATPGTTHSRPASTGSPGGAALRNALIATLYALVLLVPKLRHLQRNTHSWMLFRIFLGVTGAALVVLPFGWSKGYLFSIVGLAMFAAAILLPPAKSETNTEQKARELGALAVVNGGRFQLPHDVSVAVQLFLGAERISVLGRRSQLFLVIPVNEVTSVSTVYLDGCWTLRIACPDFTAAFSYRGIFAEHLARSAESTVQSVIRPSVAVIPQARAAGA